MTTTQPQAGDELREILAEEAAKLGFYNLPATLSATPWRAIALAAMSRLQRASTAPVGAGGVETRKPLKLGFTPEWLRDKISSEERERLEAILDEVADVRNMLNGPLSSSDKHLALEKLNAVLRDGADLAQPAQGMVTEDKARIDWLQERVVDTIYLDDGNIIDVRGLDVRKAIDAKRAALTAAMEGRDG